MEGKVIFMRKYKGNYLTAVKMCIRDSYGRIVVIYITVNNGIILPKAAIGSQYEEFVKLVRAHLPGRLK